jgi:hypothetical protein
VTQLKSVVLALCIMAIAFIMGWFFINVLTQLFELWAVRL